MDENALRAAGIDYDAALARFMGKQAIYEKYLRKLPEDAHMDAAWTALEQQDEAELLEQVHAIKGLTGTLGITGLFEQSAAIVALLRAGTREGLQGLRCPDGRSRTGWGIPAAHRKRPDPSAGKAPHR